MTILAEFRATQSAIKELEQRLESLKQNEALQQELEFEGRLNELLTTYGKQLSDVVALLEAEGKPAKAARAAKDAAPGRRTRRVKRYTNPHNGAVIETKGGNHNTLKEWKATWGGDEVESWAVVLD